MSQKIAIDLVLNKADTATNIKETKAAIKDLQNAALNLEQGSAGFNKLISKAGELKDRINDVQDTTKVLAGNTVENLGSSFSRMSASAVGGFQAIIGLQTAFGDESKATIQTLTQLQGLMAFTSGIKEFANIGQSVRDFSTTLTIAISKLTTKTAVQEADTAAVVAGTEAQVANNTVMAAAGGPIGILTIALLAAGGAYLYFSNKQEEARKNLYEYNKAINDINFSNNQTKLDLDALILKNDALTKGYDKTTLALKNLNIETTKNVASTQKQASDEYQKFFQDNFKTIEKYQDLLSKKGNTAFSQYFIEKGLKPFEDTTTKEGQIIAQEKALRENVSKVQLDAIKAGEATQTKLELDNARDLAYAKQMVIFAGEEAKNAIIRNEFNKRQNELKTQQARENAALQLQYDTQQLDKEVYEQKKLEIDKKYAGLNAVNTKARDDKAKQDALSTRETNLNILKEGYVKTQSIITDQYQVEKQLLSDKYAEAKRINANGKQGELALTAQYNLQLVQLEKSKNNMLLVLAQENAARQSSIIQNRVQSLLERGQAPVDYIGKLQSSTKTQAQADFAASDSGRKLVEAGKLAGSSPEASKLFQDLQAEEQAFIETRMRAIKGTTDAIKIAGLDITTTNKNLYNTEASFLLNIQNMTFESYKNSQEQINQYKKEQLDKNMEAELIAAGDNEKAKAEIRAKYALQETQLKDDIRRKNIENEISTLNTVKQYAETGLQAIEDVYDLFNAQREAKDVKSKAEEEKRAKDRFYVFKALNLSLAVVQGYINSQAAFKGIALATDPFSKAAAIAQFVATTVQSAVTVAKIAASEYKSSATSGGASGAQNTAASINLYGQGGNQNNLSVTNQNQRDKDIRVYVVENDISQAQTNVGRYKTSVSLG